jgi:hypothetical protein
MFAIVFWVAAMTAVIDVQELGWGDALIGSSSAPLCPATWPLFMEHNTLFISNKRRWSPCLAGYIHRFRLTQDSLGHSTK